MLRLLSTASITPLFLMLWYHPRNCIYPMFVEVRKYDASVFLASVMLSIQEVMLLGFACPIIPVISALEFVMMQSVVHFITVHYGVPVYTKWSCRAAIEYVYGSLAMGSFLTAVVFVCSDILSDISKAIVAIGAPLFFVGGLAWGFLYHFRQIKLCRRWWLPFLDDEPPADPDEERTPEEAKKDIADGEDAHSAETQGCAGNEMVENPSAVGEHSAAVRESLEAPSSHDHAYAAEMQRADTLGTWHSVESFNSSVALGCSLGSFREHQSDDAAPIPAEDVVQREEPGGLWQRLYSVRGDQAAALPDGALAVPEENLASVRGHQPEIESAA